MKKLSALIFAALLAAAAAPVSAENLESLKAGNFDVALPQLARITATGAADFLSEASTLARIPGYGELIHILPSEPSYRRKKDTEGRNEQEEAEYEKIWRLSPISSYYTFGEARAMKDFWRRLLEGSGLTITTHSVTSIFAGHYDFEIEYSGEKYLALYESDRIYPSLDAAGTARDWAESALKASGLTSVKSFVVRGGGGYMVMAYYQVTHSKKEGERIRSRRYSPLILSKNETASQAQADKDAAALKKLAIPVLETSVTSGPNGSIHTLHYIGSADFVRSHTSSTFKDKAAASAGLEAFVENLPGAAVMGSKVFPSGPFFEDGHAFSVRYAQRPLLTHQSGAAAK